MIVSAKIQHKLILLITLIGLLAPIQSIQASCSFINTIRGIFVRPPKLLNSYRQSIFDSFIESNGFKHLATDVELKKIFNLTEDCRSRFSYCDELFSDTKGVRFKEILELTQKIKADKTLEWANTKEKIAYLYQILPEFPEYSEKIIKELRNSPLLKGALSPKSAPRTFLTYSYEKEGRDPRISFYYKLAEHTDESWLDLNEKTRLELLFKSEPRSIVATQFKPKSLGPFTKELSQIRARREVGKIDAYEVKHHDFELTLPDHLKAVEEIGDELKYSDLHTHIVFEVSKNYSKKSFSKFKSWAKHQNDYTLMKGMEEGLHPNWLTGAATKRSDFQIDPRIFKKGKEEYGLGTLPNSFKEIDRQSHKFFGFALRADIYGKPILKDHLKIGIELRDFTRKKEVYQSFVSRTSKSVANEEWLNTPPSTFALGSFTFNETRSFAINQMQKSKVSSSFAAKLWDSNTFAALPLNNYETGNFISYTSGEWIKPGAEKTKQLVQAREKYIKAMQDLELEYNNFIQKGEKVSAEDLELVIKQCLSTWAKESKVSELYSQ